MGVAFLTRVVAILEYRRFGVSPFLLLPFRLVSYDRYPTVELLPLVPVFRSSLAVATIGFPATDTVNCSNFGRSGYSPGSCRPAYSESVVSLVYSNPL